jgi:hypothetical protein
MKQEAAFNAQYQMFLSKLSQKRIDEHDAHSDVLIRAEFNSLVEQYNAKQMEKQLREPTTSPTRLLRTREEYLRQLSALLTHQVEHALDFVLQRDIMDLFLALIPTVPDKGPGVTVAEIEKKSDERAEVQTALAEYGLLFKAVSLLQSSNPLIISKTLQVLRRLFEGGNEKLQQMLLTRFESTGDPSFFEDVRTRLQTHTADLKSRRRALQRAVTDDDADENGGSGSDGLDDEGDEQDFGLRLLQFLQNTCEGHFTPMKNFLRDQHTNNRSFNLVADIASYAQEIEKSMMGRKGDSVFLRPEMLALAIQLFRSLTEFCSGCSANVKAVVNAKIVLTINRYLHRLLPPNKVWRVACVSALFANFGSLLLLS